MTRVLVTDGEQRSTLAVVRSLGRAGFHVDVCAGSPKSLAGASRHAKTSHVVPSPERDPGGYLTALERLVDDGSVELLLPMTDVAASLALRLRESRPGLVIPFPDTGTWEAVSDKNHLMQVAARLGVAVPEQLVLTDADSLGAARAWAGRTGFPVVLKPHRSAVRTDEGVKKLGVKIAADVDALSDVLSGYPDYAYPILLQEWISGPALGGFFLTHDGRMIASFGHRRLREKPPTGGVSVLRESVALRSDVLLASTTLLEHFRWSGAAMVEFKEDSATGTPYLMEINGRFWGSLQLAIDAGVDFPALLVAEALGSPSGAVEGFRPGVRSRWLWGDVDHLLWLLRAGARQRAVHPGLPSRLRAVGRFLRPGWPRTRFEVLRASDPMPFLRESLDWFRALGR